MLRVSRVDHGLATLALKIESTCPDRESTSQFIQEKYSNHYPISCFPKGDPSLELYARNLNVRIQIGKEQESFSPFSLLSDLPIEESEVYTKPFTSEEKRIVEDYFFYRFQGKNPEFSEQSMILYGLKNGRRKNTLTSMAPVTMGGEKSVHFVCFRGKKDDLKYAVALEPRAGGARDIVISSMDIEVFSSPKRKELFQKMWLTPSGVAVTKYASQGDLVQYVREHPRLDREALVEQMIRVCCQFLRDYGRVHRDIKLNNFVMNKNGRLALIDFGFAKKYNPEKREKVRAGTASGFPPEYRTPMDLRQVDFYALGIAILQVYQPKLFSKIDFAKGRGRIIDYCQKVVQNKQEKILETIPDRVKQIAKKLISEYATLTLEDVESMGLMSHSESELHPF